MKNMMKTKSKLSPMRTSKYYFYDKATNIVYYSKIKAHSKGMVYLGKSNNPKPSMAAAVFMNQEKDKENHTGFSLKKFTSKK